MFTPKLGAWGAWGLGELGWWWPGSRHTGTSCLQNRAMWVLAGEMPAAGTGEMLRSLGFTYICVCIPRYMYIYLCTCILCKRSDPKHCHGKYTEIMHCSFASPPMHLLTSHGFTRTVSNL